MILILNVVFVLAAVMNIVWAIKYRRECLNLRRMVGFHRRMIQFLQSMHEAHELHDLDGVNLFYQRFQDTSREYDRWLKGDK